jgi:hypothetical protein
MAYWEGSPEQYSLMRELQSLKVQYAPSPSNINAIHSDRYTMVNPVTGQTPSKEDMEYAKNHIQELYDSGMIREDRWAFLWYH